MIGALCCEHSACSAARALPALLRVSLPAAVEGPGAGLQQASSKNNNLKIKMMGLVRAWLMPAFKEAAEGKL